MRCRGAAAHPVVRFFKVEPHRLTHGSGRDVELRRRRMQGAARVVSHAIQRLGRGLEPLRGTNGFREQTDLALADHSRVEIQVIEQVFRHAQLHFGHQTGFVRAVPQADFAEKGFVEGLNLRHASCAAAGPSLPRQEVHDPGNVQALRTACRTRLTRGAQPWGIRMQGDVFLAKLNSSHDLVGLPVEKLANRAPACAFGALVAKIDVLTQCLMDASGKLPVDLHRLRVCHEGLSHGLLLRFNRFDLGSRK